jgi:hypothetical protein
MLEDTVLYEFESEHTGVYQGKRSRSSTSMIIDVT